MKKKQLFALSGVLVVLAIGLFLMPTPGEPEFVCATDTSKTSGFVDDDQDGCPISIESYAEYSDWNSKPKLDNIAGLVLLVGGIGTAGVAAFRKTKPTT